MKEDDTYVAGCNGSCREEEDDGPKTMQEEMNDILEAFYSEVGEQEMYEFQQFMESATKQSIAEGALDCPDECPSFELEDQDGDKVTLGDVLKKGPLVLQFYRGKWCPLCNAQLQRLQRAGLPLFNEKGATLVAVSPMLPDGTQYLSTKRDLQFSVCSDVGNTLAKKFNITMEVTPEFREMHLRQGKNLPEENGDETWEIPLPATYVIDQNGIIVFSFIDNDPHIRCDIDEIAAAIPSDKKENDVCIFPRIRTVNRKDISSTFKRSSDIKHLFGKRKLPGDQLLKKYCL
mmetsp:Transcript_19344/g.40783  ORF Transcript_19344/g.40783 Transcript_19344/m.40783 type:complete len:289 (+) Transcript_19344:258-1124(+)|eukprot:CAMPEP_0183729220 /NCGR_PEP_ID=MMETSP0737-20130205/29968_1 /TAXON_ID=385413 /ORGANISM="Thalassiosira miniscula, Strain CCMP1093" /LENGTH=288 /DNA_ID=CAMNT_0025961367 /DNA_START=185 /DNA_END=1051 /DNA_ORIENTATION=+